MTAIDPKQFRSRHLTARRMALLATTVFGLTAGALLAGPGFSPNAPLAPIAHAQDLSQQAARQSARPVGFADIVDTVKPAVVSVRVKVDEGAQVSNLRDLPFPKGSQMEQFFRRFGLPDGIPAPRGRQATGQGSGFLISADGYAVTNNHVVERASSVEVTLDDGRTFDAKVIGSDPRTDLALIKLDGESFPYVSFAGNPPRVGDWVLAVGNPFGLGGTVTAGIVSARGRDIGAGPYDDFIQIDAPVNRGNSGGPTFNVDGQVIGVNTAIYSPSGGSVGIAFAIPAETVRNVVEQLQEKGTVTRGWIGVHIQPITPEIAEGLNLPARVGALVAEPQAASPALKAGIQAGDVIVSVDKSPVKDARELSRRIGSMTPGTTVNLGILRKGTEQTIELTLGELPQQPEVRADRRGPRMHRESHENRLGLSLAPGGSEPGVVVAEVDPAGPAANFGLRAGDVILEVAGKAVATPRDVLQALREARREGRRSIVMRIKSQQGTRFVAIPLGRA